MIKITMTHGYLGKDAEVIDVNGKQTMAFNVAHREKVNKKGVVTYKTTWIKCYKPYSEGLASWLKAGTLVYLEGSVSFHQWKNEKTKKLETDIRMSVSNLTLLPAKKSKEKEIEITDENVEEVMSKCYDIIAKRKQQAKKQQESKKAVAKEVVEDDVDDFDDDVVDDDVVDDVEETIRRDNEIDNSTGSSVSNDSLQQKANEKMKAKAEQERLEREALDDARSGFDDKPF